MTGIDIDIKVSGNKGHINEEELIEAQKQFIDFWEKNVKFFPFDTPENFLKELDNDPRFLGPAENNINGKEYFKRKTMDSLGMKEITSSDIYAEQKRVVAKINENNELYKSVLNMLNELF